jgi:hypothetical protein
MKIHITFVMCGLVPAMNPHSGAALAAVALAAEALAAAEPASAGPATMRSAAKAAGPAGAMPNPTARTAINTGNRPIRIYTSVSASQGTRTVMEASAPWVEDLQAFAWSSPLHMIKKAQAG